MAQPAPSHCQRIVTPHRKEACSKETDYNLCFDCLGIMRKVIEDIGELTEELQIQLTKQVKGAPSLGGRTDEPPLPFDTFSSDVLHEVDLVLGHYFAQHAPRKAHHDIQGLTQERRIHTLVKWHLRYYTYVGRSEQGPAALAAFDNVLAKASRAVDRKNSKVWIGNCECGLAVMAWPNQTSMVKCECGREYDPKQSRRDLRVLGGQQIITPAQAERLGEIWGKQLKRSTIQKWRQRGKVECMNDPCLNCNPHRYRLSDLLAAHKEN